MKQSHIRIEITERADEMVGAPDLAARLRYMADGLDGLHADATRYPWLTSFAWKEVEVDE